MNNIIFLIVLVVLSNTAVCQSKIDDNISVRIANRMQDTLSLAFNERNQVEEINRLLAFRKQSVFKYFTNRDSLQVNLQKIENTRDSLYKSVLSTEKYQLYKEKKRNLVNGN